MTPVMPRPVALSVLCAAIFFAGGARADDYVATEHAQSWLAPERDGVAPGETTWFAFSQKLQKGWHVYWKNPGDSGLALELDWSLPEGYAAGEIVFPAPERIPVGPFTNFGHHGEPVFLIPVTAPKEARVGDAAEIGLIARWLICEEICVPEEGAFSLSITVRPAPAMNAEGAELVAKARAATPPAFDGDARFDAGPTALVLDMPAPAASARDVYFFPEAEGLTEPSAAQPMRLEGGRLRISMRPGIAYEPETLQALDGVLSYSAAGGARKSLAVSAVKSDAPIAAPVAAATPAAGAPNILPLLLAAFFGGVILNVMPCVFPILFIKAASLIKGAGADRPLIRRQGALYGAGVVVTFAALGGLLLALRAGGEQLGWGFHLQSPAVVMLSAYVLFLVGLNLAGVFHAGESLAGVGGGITAKGGDVGALLTGALAVFVAAPCVGPLLSAPMGAAVLLPPSAGMLIFIVLGLGLAAPYVALSFVPALGRLLPKPGPWMIVFKQALAFPVFAAAAYFLWVLAVQTGSAGVARALLGALLLAFAAWLFEQSKKSARRALVVRAAAGLAALAALAPLFNLRLVETATASAGHYGRIESMAYDPARLQSLRAEGRPVFLDFTAAWCVVCQFNKLAVLSKPSVSSAFAGNDVALMVADWTRRDPEISQALADFGANGVPLYVYYPSEGEPQVLALPLTERAILNAVDHRPTKE